ncbi:MAG: chemotaxis protein CheW [Gammaproteobacteria bacterium]|nr:chemotaxis protein CheW [Gammaproteobacteria bacterium]MCH9744248.1 chemotaxis protein CheW [Gammaproteobacteria bacterium]
MSDEESASIEMQEILHKRMEKLAAIKVVDDKHYQKYLHFKLGREEQYGIPYSYLKEILYVKKFVEVPCTPEYIIGVINWRSKILAVLDLKKIFNIESNHSEKSSWVVVVKSGDIVMGIVADDIIGDETCVLSEIADPLPLNESIKRKYITGIDKGSIALLNIEATLGQYCSILQDSNVDE